MKKAVSLFLLSLILMLSLFTAGPAEAAFDSGELSGTLYSKVYYMESLDEGTVFFEKDADEKVPPAAFIKLIVAAVAAEKWGNLDETVTITSQHLNLIKYDYGVRVALYKTGERVSKRELIQCLVVHSANDAAAIIAYEISGSLEGFISEMESLLTRAGCTSTVVKNITGFDEEGQYTTARDVAKLMKYANSFSAFSEAISAQSVTLAETEQNSERTYTSGNKMTNATISDYYHKSVTGGKYTSTDEAGECVAVVSALDGYSYLTVVMGGEMKDVDKDTVNENTAFVDAKAMLSWVYKNIRYRVIVSPNQNVAVLDVVAGKGTDRVSLVPEKETSALVPSKVTPASVLFEIVEGSVPENLTAPIKQGEVLGQAKVFYAGQELATVNLVAAEEVKLSTFGLIMHGVNSVVSSTVFLILALLAFIACGGWLVYTVFGGDVDGKLEKRKASRKKKSAKGKKPQKKTSDKKTK